jgi:hypothetical protein
MTTIFFKTEYVVRELWIPSDTNLNFNFSGPHKLSIVICAPTKDEIVIGHQKNNAFCIATSSSEPNEKCKRVFENITKNRIIQGDKPEIHWRTEYSLQDGSTIQIPGMLDFPDFFQSYAQNILCELREKSFQTVSVLRWRANELGPHDPFGMKSFNWSYDRVFWHPMPINWKIRMTTQQPLNSLKNIIDDVSKIVNENGLAPLYHDLFREAWWQRSENPRSAIIIGIAAAELSVKQCIATLIPDAEWLALNLPTPPLINMLNEYLPKLPTINKINDKVIPPPPSILATLKKGVTIRNQLAHTGNSKPTFDDVQEILNAVHDLLWMVDYYLGSSWALDNLRAETKAMLVGAK